MYVLFLSLLSCLGVVSISFAIPALPTIQQVFHLETTSLQWLITLFFLGNVCGQIISGPLSDRLGRRRVLLIALSLFTIASFLMASAPSYAALLLARFLQGVGGAAGPILARALSFELFEQKKIPKIQAFGFFAIGLASIIATFLSGLFTEWSWRLNFWFLAALGIVLITICRSMLTHEISYTHESFLLKLKNVWKNRTFLSQTLLHASTYGMMYGYVTLFPFYITALTHKNDPSLISLYTNLMIVAYLVASFLLSLFEKVFSHTMFFKFALLCQISAAIFFFLLPESFLPFYLFNFSLGIILPLTMTYALQVFDNERMGTASSSIAISSRILGSVVTWGITQLPFSITTSLGIGVMLLFILGSFTNTLRERKSAG